MKLERHVGGLSIKRKTDYLRRRGWSETDDGWVAPVTDASAVKLAKAVHHQLTRDLCEGLARYGWSVVGYSERGYAKLLDPKDASTCALPAALRRQAKREGALVREFTYGLFLNALL